MENQEEKKVSVIIVTHDSELFIHKALDQVLKQTRAVHEILLVDTGSKDRAYLNPYQTNAKIKLLFAGNEVGFCQGNNFGMRHLSEYDYLLLLNPDAFLEVDFIEKAVEYMEAPSQASVGIVTGKLLGFDIRKNEPTGKYDSTGIFRTFWGRWYDRGQGQPIVENCFEKEESLPAICGALMFMRKAAVADVLLKDGSIFDPSFYMYKEDIDLSLRCRKKGWRLKYQPLLKAYHCRGWNVDRKKMAKKIRLISARNELKIHWRMRSCLGMCYSTVKYSLVALFNA